MNDNEATRLLDRAAEALIPVEPAPLTSLLTAAKQGQRQKSRRVVAVAAASVALVLGGGAVIQQVTGDSGKPSPDKPSQNLTSDVPIAPEGTRFVGIGQVVVAVPKSWTVRDGEDCPLSAETQQWSGLRLGTPCASDEVKSVVTFETGTSRYEPLIQERGMNAKTINGIEVSRGDFICPPTTTCTMPDAMVLTIPSMDVTISWLGGVLGQSPVAEMANSLQLLPEGYTTVPYVTGSSVGGAMQDIKGAGLVSGQDPTSFDVDANQKVFGSQPEPGSLVEVGSTVTLIVDPPGNLTPLENNSPMTVTPSTARPGDVVALMFPNSTERSIRFTLTPLCPGALACPSTSPEQLGWVLYSDALGGEPTWSVGDRKGTSLLDVATEGPDHVVIPEPASDGAYQLCTLNTFEQMCTSIQVTADPTRPTTEGRQDTPADGDR